MSAFYDDAAATAADMLSEFGQAVTLTHTAPGVYDPATGTTTPTVTTQTGTGVVFEYNTFIRSGMRNEKDTLIRAGDKQLLLSPLNSVGAPLAAPQIDDVATIGGIGYTITSIAPLSPAGTVIYYECNIRGAA